MTAQATASVSKAPSDARASTGTPTTRSPQQSWTISPAPSCSGSFFSNPCLYSFSNPAFFQVPYHDERVGTQRAGGEGQGRTTPS